MDLQTGKENVFLSLVSIVSMVSEVGHELQ